MHAETELLVAWARLAGENALLLFFALLAVVLGVAWTFWWALQRYAVPGPQSARSAPLPDRSNGSEAGVDALLMGVRIGLGFLAIVAGGWIFAELADEIGAEDELGRADQALTDALQASVSPAALQAFAFITRLGDTATITAICAVVAVALVAAGRRGLALGWVAAVAGNGLLNVSLKLVFARVRPLHPDALAEGFSFPSGHSSGSVVTYGLLAYLALRLLPQRWHLPAALAAVALAFTVGASRVFLRVHFASDVLAGFASGTAWLAVCIASIEVTRWYRRRDRQRDL